MEGKSKTELLMQRLDRIKKNSQNIINKMDNQINSIKDLQNDLNNKSQRMTDWTNKFQALIQSVGEKIFSNSINSLTQPQPNYVGPIPKKQTVQYVCRKILQAKQICILTGAGVSKNSGIPTFRDKDGLYSKKMQIKVNEQTIRQLDPDQFLTLKTFNQYPEQIWKWCNQIKQLVQSKDIGVQHKIINLICIELNKIGKNISLVTTNIDSLHYKALQNNKKEEQYNLYQIHGNFRKYLCTKCFQQYPIAQNYQKFKCQKCNQKILRPFIMFFDQNYQNLFDLTNLRKKQFDLTIVIGTSLQTGLSIKIVSSSKIIIEINPKCVIKVGEVYQFERQCQKILAQLYMELKIKIKDIKIF